MKHKWKSSRYSLLTLLPDHLPPEASTEQNATSHIESIVRNWTKNQIATGNKTELYEQFQRTFEPAFFKTVMAQLDGNKVSVAECLGLHRATLRRKLQIQEKD